jgi:hypothetical protein
MNQFIARAAPVPSRGRKQQQSLAESEDQGRHTLLFYEQLVQMHVRHWTTKRGDDMVEERFGLELMVDCHGGRGLFVPKVCRDGVVESYCVVPDLGGVRYTITSSAPAIPQLIHIPTFQ